LSLDEVVALALEELLLAGSISPTEPSPSPIRRPQKPEHDRTAREIEVLRLVAAGLSNPDIAGYLTLSIYTVQTHLRSIFSKIDVTNRATAVRYVFEHSLG